MRGSNCRGMDHGWLVFLLKKLEKMMKQKSPVGPT